MVLAQRADLGHGNVKKLLFSLSVPTITSQIVNLLYNLVDRVFIGHMQPAETVGKLALTGVGVCLPSAAHRALRLPMVRARVKGQSALWATA